MTTTTRRRRPASSAPSRTLDPSRINMPPPTRRMTTLDPRDMPDVYAMYVSGTCMEPYIHDGSYLKFTTTEPPVLGDFVNLYMRPELVPPGQPQALLKRLVVAPPPWITLPHREGAGDAARLVVIVEQLNPWAFHTIRCGDLLGMHRCVGLVAPDERRIRLTDDELRALARRAGGGGR